jgi:hypothetical protein
MTIPRHGVMGSEAEGVYFTQAAAIAGARDLGEVKVELGGQNKDLRYIKAALAAEVRRRGGDGLVAFAYGQRGNPWWRSLSGLFDAEHWYGSGRAVVLPRQGAGPT